MWSRWYRWLEVVALFACLGLLVAGLLMTVKAIGHDEGWLARAGGLITLLSAWFVLPAEAERARITNNMHWIEARGGAEIEALRELYGDAVANEVRDFFNRARLRLEEKARKGVRLMEIFVITVGTILWALGDLAKFAKPLLGLSCVTCG